MRKLFALFLLCSASAFGQTATISGHLQDPGTSNVNSRTFVRFELKNAGGQQCRINGTALITPYLKDFTPSVSGVLSGTIYQNSAITCGTQTGQTQWAVTIWRDGKPQPSCFTTITTSSVNLDSLACTNTTAVVAAPTGDTTYIRRDGGNSMAGNLVPDANGTRSIGTAGGRFQINATTVGVSGPNPWYDVCQNGFACDAITSDTAAFNALVLAACNAGGGTLWFPPATTVRFGSAPNHIPCGLTLVGTYSKGSAFGFGSFIKCDYTESTATNGCLWWDGANAATQGNGGGVRGINIQKGDGKTGGVAIKLGGTDCTARAGGAHFDGVKISSNTGTWNYDVYVDGSTCTTAGTAGSRDNYFADLYTFSATTEAIHLDNCVHCFLLGVETSPGTSPGVGDVNITGAGTGTAASNDVNLAADAITGNLTLANATSINIAGTHVTGNLTTTANLTAAFFTGTVDGTVTNNGGLSYCLNKGCVIQNPISASGAIQSTNGPIAAGSAPGAIQSGDVSSARGTYWFGLFDAANTLLQEVVAGKFIFKTASATPSFGVGASDASHCIWKNSASATWASRTGDDSADCALSAGTKGITGGTYSTNTNCASPGGTCGSAAAGRVTIAAAATTVTVATTAVTANSEIVVQEDATLGTALSVTCNTTTGRTYTVTTRTAATSFIITASGAPAANPACLSYNIVN